MTDLSRHTEANDSEQVSRPWTPGEWIYSGSVIHVEGDPYTGAIASTYQRGQTLANGELIALAPQMAAAILQVADWMTPAGPLSNSAGHATGILGVAAKLRAIGASDA